MDQDKNYKQIGWTEPGSGFVAKTQRKKHWVPVYIRVKRTTIENIIQTERSTPWYD